MTDKQEDSVNKWNETINKAREAKLLNEDILFQLYFQTTYDVWYMSHNRYRPDRTGVAEKDIEGVLEYYQSLVNPISTVLREDFNLNSSVSEDNDENERKKFMDWYKEQQQKTEADTQEARDFNRDISMQWQKINELP